MRAATVIFLWILLAAGGLAQPPDRKLLERITKSPDLSLVSSMEGRSFAGGGGFALGKKPTVPTAFGFDEKASTPEFGGNRSFLGIKNPWFGNKVYDSGAANVLPKSLIANADRKFTVAGESTAPYSGAGKMMAGVPAGAVPTRAFAGRGGAQGALDQISAQLGKGLTIDDVREILNKNQ